MKTLTIPSHKLCALLLTLVLFTAFRAKATVYTWTNTTGGNWNAAANWSPNQVPGSNDTANITTAGTYAVTLNVAANVESLTIGGAGSGAQTLQGNGLNLIATNASLNNAGVVSLTNSTMQGAFTVGSGAVLSVNDSTMEIQVTVENGGELLLVGSQTYMGGNGYAGNSNCWLWMQTGSELMASSSSYLYLWVPMTNSGACYMTNEGFQVYNNNTVGQEGGLINLPGGVINLISTAGIRGQDGFSYMANQGTINVTNGSSTISIDFLTNTGSVSTLAGAPATLTMGNFSGLGSLTGNFNAGAGTTIDLEATASPGTSAGAGLTLGGSGTYQFTSGLLTLSTNTIPGLQMTSGMLALGAGFQGGAITNLALDGITLTNTLPVAGPLLVTNSTLLGTYVVPSGVVLTANDAIIEAQVTVENGGELLLVGSQTYMGGNGYAGNSNCWLWMQTGSELMASSSSYLYLWVPMTNSGACYMTNEGFQVYNNNTVGQEGGLINLPGGVINLISTAGIRGQDGFSYMANQGTINVTNGSSTISIDFLTNTGSVSTLAGAPATLTMGNFSGLGSLTGNFNAGAGTTIDLEATASPGTSAGAGLTLGGSGTYQFTSGLLTLSTNTIPGLQMTSGMLALGAGFQGGAITNLALDGITLTNTLPVAGPLLVTNSTLLGTYVVPSGVVLTANDAIIEAQVTVENGGELLLVGSTTHMGGNGYAGNSNCWLWMQTGSELMASSSSYLYLWVPMTNSGACYMTNEGFQVYNNNTVGQEGGLINLPGGVINLISTAGIRGQDGFSYMANQGTINVTNGSSTISIDFLTNTGSVSTLAGAPATLTMGNFSGLGSLTGNFNAGAGTTIDLEATASPGTSAGAGLTLGGSGTYQFTSGLLTLPNNTISGLQLTGGVVEPGPAFQGGAFTNLVVDGSTLSNLTSLPATGILVLTNTTMVGTCLVASGAVVSVNDCTMETQLTVENGGELRQIGGTSTSFGNNGYPGNTNCWLWLQSGSQLINASTSPAYLWAPMTNSGTCYMTNSGFYVYNNHTSGQDGSLLNLPGGVINLTGGASILGEDGFDYVLNQGIIAVYSSNATSSLNMDYLTNTGTLSVQHGTLQLEAPHLALTSGTLNVGLNNSNDFGGFSYYGATTLNLNQVGTFQVTLNGSYVPVTNTVFKVLSTASSGTFSGAFASFASPSGAIWQTNYTPASFVLTNVGQMIWSPPANITYGTALGLNQLDASTTPSLAGSFNYNPTAGTVLDSGVGQILTATFSPSATSYAAASLQVPIDVLKAPLSIAANNQSKTYGQTITFAGTEFMASGLVNGDTVTSATIASAGSPSTAAVSGSPYSITINNAVGDAGLTNYNISYTPGSLTVNPAPLTITADNTNKIYGQTITFAGTEFASTTLSNGETIGSVTLASSGAVSNAPVASSPYNIMPSAATGGTFSTNNYQITYLDGSLTVNQAALTVTANPASRDYGAANPAFTATYSGFVNNENASVVSGAPGFSTPAIPASPVGPYSIMPSLGTLTAANYAFTSFVNGILTINQEPLTVTASAESKTYGQTVNFGGGSTLFTSAGLQNSDTITSVTLTVSGNGGAPAASVASSPYTITPSAAIGTFTPANYFIVYSNGNLTVNPAPLTVTADAQSKTYGQTVNFGPGSMLFTSAGLQNSETIGTVTLSVSGNGGAATATVAGSPYIITPSAATTGTFSSGNYTITYATNGLTVNTANLTVTADNLTKIYGQSVTFAGTEFTTSGLLNSDTVTTVTLTSGGAAANATLAGSPYNIVPRAAQGSGVGNYNIAYDDGLLSIALPNLNIAASLPNTVLSWTTNASAFVLNQTASLSEPVAWTPVTNTITVSGTNNTVTIPAAGAKFYALIAP